MLRITRSDKLCFVTRKKMKKKTLSTLSTTDEIQKIVASLKDTQTCLLIVDTKKCLHSQRLLEEVRIMTELHTCKSSSKIMHVLDVCDQEVKALDMLTWLPGVPVLLYLGKIHLGLDAFSKCRELCRNIMDGEGYTLQTLALN
jgi:hypothetical protein